MAKREQFITAAGVARYPWLNKPDTKFNEDGVFKIDVIYDASDEEAQEMMSQIDTMVDENFDEVTSEMKPAQAKKLEKKHPYFFEEDEDTGEETGRVVFRFASNASGQIKKGPKAGQRWSKKCIPVFDAKNKRTKAQVGSGSIVKVAYTTSAYHAAALKLAGIKLYLEGVQVIKLEAAGNGPADGGSMGFGTEDGGFEDDGSHDASSADESGSDDNGSEDEADY